jgi:hypothetical protein
VTFLTSNITRQWASKTKNIYTRSKVENTYFGKTKNGMKTRTAAHNKVLPKAGLNGFDWTFVQGSTFVLRLKFCAKNPRLRQYPKRQSV